MSASGRTALAGMFLALCPYAFALNPALDVSQYAHTAWKNRDGFAKGLIQDIVQTSDGYLWLGTELGLLRFDGVRAVPWQPPPDQRLPSTNIRKLLAARDGTLWIGTNSGLASWKNGRLTLYPEVGGSTVASLLEDRGDTIWVSTNFPEGRLCEIQNGNVRCHSDVAALGQGVYGLHEDSKGNLWVGTSAGVWRWKPGSPQFYSFAQRSGIQGMADAENGALLMSTTGAVRRLLDGKIQIAYPYPVTMRESQAFHLLRDRDGGLWVGTSDRGIVHIHQGRTDVFSQPDGLSGVGILHFFEDREGNIWVASRDGLDRFRELPVVTYSTAQGLSNRLGGPVLAGKDRSVWFSTLDGLDRLNNGQITVYREHNSRPVPGVREIAVSGLPGQGLESLFQDSQGRIWVSARNIIGYLENDRFISTAAPGGNVHAIAEDGAGNLWIANQQLGLLRLSPANEVQQFSWSKLGHKDTGFPLTYDRSVGGLWLGFAQGGLVLFRDGQVRASYSAADGLGEGRVNDLRLDSHGALWAATEGGLSRLKDGRIATLTSRNGLPCDAVLWSIEDDVQSVWLMMPCGLVRVARSELDAWAAASDKVGRALRTTVFDNSDGVQTRALAVGYTPHFAKSVDGKLWFYNVDGLGMVDPRHLPFNKLPPPVHIEQIIADRKVVSNLRLPALTRDLEIDYTALSLVAPEKNRFKYKLEGFDSDWQDAGNRRQAFYTNLAPRNYRFRVQAANNDGVWNEAGAALDFSVAPAYYQTAWFRTAIAAGILALFWGLYRLRLYQLARDYNLRLEERVGERTRIARDLHDTLLQSFQGVLLKFHAVTYLIPDRPSEAQKTLETAIEQARQAITEGRYAVEGLRSSTMVTNDLASTITVLGQEFAGEQNGRITPEFRVQVEGTPKSLAPILRDEVYQIACESLRNAFRHAHAKRIEVEIRYDRRQFRLRVRDDGKGIETKVLSKGGRAGHYGLPGMHERAKLVGGTLAVWSELNSGTEMELVVPASVAYAKSPVARASAVSGKGT